jgi:hypothetical protein
LGLAAAAGLGEVELAGVAVFAGVALGLTVKEAEGVASADRA